MPKTRKTRGQQEILNRYLTIDQWNPSFSVGVDKPRGLPPERRTQHSLDFIGTLVEPLKGLTAVRGTIFPAKDVAVSNAEKPCVAVIISMREKIDVVAHVSHEEFLWLLTMVGGKLLGAAYMTFNTPLRGHALVISLSFFGALPPEDGR